MGVVPGGGRNVDRPTLDYHTPPGVRRRASGEVASAIVGITIFSVAGLLVGLFGFGVVMEGASWLLGVLVPVVIVMGFGVWVNVRALRREGG